jgi:hypothetical protein
MLCWLGPLAPGCDSVQSGRRQPQLEFWSLILPSCSPSLPSAPERGGNNLLRKFGKLLPDCTVSHLRRQRPPPAVTAYKPYKPGLWQWRVGQYLLACGFRQPCKLCWIEGCKPINICNVLAVAASSIKRTLRVCMHCLQPTHFHVKRCFMIRHYQWSSTCGTRTTGSTPRHFRGYANKSHGVCKIEKKILFRNKHRY